MHCRRRFDEALKLIPKSYQKESNAFLLMKQIQAIYREEGKLLAILRLRMEDVYTTEDKFSKEHMSAEDILNACSNSYQGKGMTTKVRMSYTL